MGEWKECTLSDLVEINKQNINKDYPHSEILYLDTGSVTEGKIDGFQKYSLKEAPSRAKRLVQHNDIIYSTVRPIQRHYGLIENPEDNLVVSTGFAVIVTNPKKANPKFLYYFLSSDEVVELLDSIAEGSTSAYPSLKPSDLERLDVDLPPLPEQRAIATVLSSLDDKIDLLQRQNATLEALAETLFRQWFVEEAGEDWEEVSLYDAIDLIGGGTPKTSVDEYWNGEIKWLSGGDISDNHKGIITHSEKFITKRGLENSSAKLLPKYSTVISARGTVGKYCILSEPMAFSQSNYGIKPKFKGCYFFTYLMINNLVEQLQSAAYGSVFDTITTKTFKGFDVLIPEIEELLEFENKVKPYFLKMEQNERQIHTLEKLRDTLLPKLMSGEVEVKMDEVKRQPANIIPLKKKKKGNPKFREAVLISAIVRAFYTPKIDSVSRQWYQKISYHHKRKMNDESAKMYELLEEYGKKPAGPYKREMRYQGPEGIALSNEYLEAVDGKAFKPAKNIDQIDKYFYEYDYWNWKLFQNWTVPNLEYKSVKKLGVWATIDYCLLELNQKGKELNTENVIKFISESKEWKHKIKQPEFSPENVEKAIQELFGMYSY